METPDFSQSDSSIEQHIYGNRNVTVGHNSGGIVININEDKKVPPEPKARPLPIDLSPRPFPLLIGRQAEVKLATDTLPYRTPIEFYGPSGIGKTALLRYTAHHPEIAPVFAAGRIYLRHRHYQSASDLLQVIYDVFYENTTPTKVVDTSIRLALKDLDALVLLDGNTFPQTEIQKIIEDLPSFTFLFINSKQQLLGEGQSIKLHGLSVDNAIALISRELSHPLSTEENRAAIDIASALNGNPLHILQAVAAAREEGCSLEEIAQRVREPKQLLASLTKTQRRILALLALLAGMALAAEQITEIAQLPDVQSILDGLVRRRLLEAEGGRYRFVSELEFGTGELSSWRDSTINCFTRWLGQNTNLDQVLEESEVLFQCLEWAVQAEQWANVVPLGRSLEKALSLSGQWDAWGRVLQWLLKGAKTIGDRTLEGYVMHQLGTRSLCLNELTEARIYLEQAQGIRETINDPNIEATNQNLSYLNAPPPTNDVGRTTKPTKNLLSRLPLRLISFSIGAILLAIAGAIFLPMPPTPSPTTSPTPSPTPSSDCLIKNTSSAELTLTSNSRIKIGEQISGKLKLNCIAPKESLEFELQLHKDGQSQKLGNIIVAPGSQLGNFSFMLPGNVPTGKVELVARHRSFQNTSSEIEIYSDGTLVPDCPNSNTTIKLSNLTTEVRQGEELKGLVSLDCINSNQVTKIQLALRKNSQNLIFSDVTIEAENQQNNFNIPIPKNFPLGETTVVASHKVIKDVSDKITIEPKQSTKPTCPNSDTRLNLSLLPQQVNPGGVVNGKVTLSCAATEPINISVTSNGEGIDLSDIPIIQAGGQEDGFVISIPQSYSSPGAVTITANAEGLEDSESFSVISPPPPQPDLKIQNLDIRPLSGWYAGTEISVKFELKNSGNATAFGWSKLSRKGYLVDIFISKDNKLKKGFPRVSNVYQEDVLLKNGRFYNTPRLGPKGVKSLGDANNKLHDNVTPGDYFICVVVDPKNRINESNEDNNISCIKIKIKKLG